VLPGNLLDQLLVPGGPRLFVTAADAATAGDVIAAVTGKRVEPLGQPSGQRATAGARLAADRDERQRVGFFARTELLAPAMGAFTPLQFRLDRADDQARMMREVVIGQFHGRCSLLLSLYWKSRPRGGGLLSVRPRGTH
jgi:hypothetical protein